MRLFQEDKTPNISRPDDGQTLIVLAFNFTYVYRRENKVGSTTHLKDVQAVWGAKHNGSKKMTKQFNVSLFFKKMQTKYN